MKRPQYGAASCKTFTICSTARCVSEQKCSLFFSQTLEHVGAQGDHGLLVVISELCQEHSISKKNKKKRVGNMHVLRGVAAEFPGQCA